MYQISQNISEEEDEDDIEEEQDPHGNQKFLISSIRLFFLFI